MFTALTKDDIISIVAKIERSKLSDWTKHDYLLTVKVFYRFLKESEEYPNEVKWIKPTKVVNHRKLPRQLITIEDAKELANNTNNLRD